VCQGLLYGIHGINLAFILTLCSISLVDAFQQRRAHNLLNAGWRKKVIIVDVLSQLEGVEYDVFGPGLGELDLVAIDLGGSGNCNRTGAGVFEIQCQVVVSDPIVARVVPPGDIRIHGIITLVDMVCVAEYLLYTGCTKQQGIRQT